MGLPRRKTGSLNFTPRANWDAKTGTAILYDRVRNDFGNWTNEPRDVTEGFAAIMDMPNTQVGYLLISSGSAPELAVVPLGQDYGDRPGDDWKEGVRLLLEMAGEHAETGARELLSTAVGFWEAVSDLHDAYLAGAADHPGMLPVVEIERVRELPGKTVSYAPVFKITGWVPRPPGLPTEGIARVAPKSAPNANATTSRPRVLDDMQDEIPF
jgi:hypothetical protein